jgi:hypothetical protein
LYWSEWHNDPPQCCDPCDCYGNWVGPGAGYRAPYHHPYAPTAGVYANKGGASNQPRSARNPGSKQAPTRVARQPKSSSAAKNWQR